MFSFLHNLTTSKKQQQLQASNNSKPIDDTTLFGVSKSSKSANKSKLKCDNPKEDGILCKSSNVLNGKTKKKSTYKTKFFLRKSRWVLWESNNENQRFSDRMIPSFKFKWINRLQSIISNSNWLRTSHCNCKWIFGPLHTMKWILTSADYNIRCRRIFPSLEKQINIIDIQFKSMARPEFIGHICCLNQSHHNCHQLLNSWFSNDIQSGAHCLFAWTLPWNDPGHLEKIPSSALYVNSSYRMIMRRYLLLCSA